MSWALAFLRLVLLALVLSLVLGWLKNGDVDLAVTPPWMLFPVSGGMVTARCVIDWEGSRNKDRTFLAGALRIGAFLAIVAVAHWGFPGSLAAVLTAFVLTLVLATYGKEA